MIKNKYEVILEQFELYYPEYYQQTVDWWASGRLSITVMLENGDVFEFNRMDNTIRRIQPDNCNVDDKTLSKGLGRNIQKFILLRGISQNELASRLGITDAMLSRYIHGTSMPSAGKLFRIAKLLGCTQDELFDETYMK